MRAPLLALVLVAHTQVAAARADTIVVAPLAQASASIDGGGAEYRFVGAALSDALTSRLLSSGVALVFGQGQWEAVLRERDIAPSSTGDVDAARRVARQLGADQFIVGSYKAAWPFIDVVARRYRVDADEPEATATVSSTLDALALVEAKLAAALFVGPLQKAAQVPPSTKDALALRHLALCKAALLAQSMGPRATPWLPRALAESARTECESALARDKGLVEARAFIALARALTGERKEATRDALSVLKTKRAAGWPDLIASFLVRLDGDAAKSRQILVDAVKRTPGHLHIRSTLGEHLVEAGLVDDAERHYRALVAEVPRGPWFKAQLGKALARAGRHDDAIAVTDEAVALLPDDAIVLLEKASREIDAGKHQDAEKTLRVALEHDPRIAALYLRLGYVYLETNQPMLARPILKKALYEADRESERRVKAFAHFDLAKLAAREGDQDGALFELSKAIGAGFSDRARIERDQDLDTLRALPAYQGVMESLP